MNPDLIIVGGSGFGREVVFLVQRLGGWNLRGILDANIAPGTDILGVPVLGGDEAARDHLDAHFVVAVASPRVRYGIVQNLEALGVTQWATLIDPAAMVGPTVTLGEGSIVGAGCVLTVDIVLGRHTVINCVTTVGHDTRGGDFCLLSAQVAVSGYVTLGDGVEIGVNASIIQGQSIASGCMIGAGSVLSKPLDKPNAFAIGAPARVIKTLDAFPGTEAETDETAES